MVKQPAVVIIARHGARFDQANKQWHLTSPTPYDPPLTYAGWTQARALGARIAGILRDRENGISQTQNGNSKKRKRSKVIIHTSPFLRCIQTSIGISAGIGQVETIYVDKHPRPSLPAHPENPRSYLPLESSPLRMATNLPADGATIDLSHKHGGHLPTHLRVDAFLGEWLSPDYFENITPPPGSVLMVAAAKADLLRPGEEIKGSDLSGGINHAFGNPWPGDAPELEKSTEKTGLRAMAAVGHSLPNRNRNAVSHNSELGARRIAPRSMATVQEDQPAYIPPVPMYAISGQDVIPVGYVAHARDSCVEVEYQWDSMRPPQDWGTGGDYGEEWGAMHRRFRNGLQGLLGWYDNNSSEDDDTDAVIVLVTHGAGCNALIGAMSGQPVLLDIGLASLTMAVRKDGDDGLFSPASPRKRRGSLDLGIADQYSIEIIASTEHLRAPNNHLGLNSPRLARSPAFASRRAVGADSPDGFTIGDPLSWRPGSSGGLGRSASQRSFHASSVPRFSSGLWRSGSGQSQEDVSESSESDVLPAFDRAKNTAALNQRRASGRNDKTEPIQSTASIPIRPASPQGLWGAAPAEAEPTVAKDDFTSPKRRWTLVDNS